MSSLRGKRILVTRAKTQSGSLADELTLRGAEPLLLPLLEIADPEDFAPLDAALQNVDQFDWIVFTSANGVQALADRMKATKTSIEPKARLAVVGPSTAAAVREALREPDAMPGEYVSQAIAKEMGDLRGLKVLLPRGNLAGHELPNELKDSGAEVVEVVAYRTVRSSEPLDLNLESPPDAITLTSGEAARAAVELLSDRGLSAWLQSVPLLCIGPVTADTLRSLGYEPAAVAQPHTIKGLIEAAERFFERSEAYA